MSPSSVLAERTTHGASIDLEAFAAAGGTLHLDGADLDASALRADGTSAPVAMASPLDHFEADSFHELAKQVLSGFSGGTFTGPASYKAAVDRILDCDPLDVGLRTRARAASQVPIRLSKVKGGSQRDRERMRALIARRQLGAGRLGAASALRMPEHLEGSELTEKTQALVERNAYGRYDPHGATAAAVVMHRMHEHGELEEVTDHPLLELLARPNPLTTTTWAQLLDAVVMQRVACGEVFARPVLRAAKLGIGAPELFLVEDPTSVTVVLNEARNRLMGYDIAKTGGAKRERTTKSGAAKEKPDALVHIKDLDPLCHLRGRSHLRSAWVWTAIYLMAARWNGGLIKNGAKPSGILSRRDGRAIGGRQRERAQAEAESRSGPDNAGKPWTDGDLVWNQISLSPRDMDWETVETMAHRRCSTAVGVDPILQGIGEYSTYNNQETAMARLYTEAALPDLVWLLGGLNEGLVDQLGDDELVLWADPTEIPALRTNALDLAKTLSLSTWLADGEKRQAQGFDYDHPDGASSAATSSAEGTSA